MYLALCGPHIIQANGPLVCGLVSRDGRSAHASLPSSRRSVLWQYPRVANAIHMFTMPAAYPAEDCILQACPSSVLTIQLMTVDGSNCDFGLQSQPSYSNSFHSLRPASLTSSTYYTGRISSMSKFANVFAKSLVAITGLWVQPKSKPWNP